MMKFVRSIPMSICGLSLALAALGNLLLPYGVGIRYMLGILSAIVLVIFALKLFLDSPHALAELKTPVPLSVLPAATMAIMLLLTYIRPYIGDLAMYLWYAAIAVHLFIMLLFFKRFILKFKIGTVYPTWFIVFVGLVTISVTAPAMGARPVGQIAFYAGFALYFIALTLIIYRMVKQIYVPEPLRLTAVIFTAPMSLCIVGYFASFEQRNEMLVYIMLTIAVVSYLYVSYRMLTAFLKTKFYPTYAAFTFPYVISAAAFRLGNDFLIERGHNFLSPLATLSEWVAVLIVIYVCVHYVRFFRYVLEF